MEKIAILDYTTGEVCIYPISENEETSEFLEKKNFRESDIAWMRGKINIYIEDEA